MGNMPMARAWFWKTKLGTTAAPKGPSLWDAVSSLASKGLGRKREGSAVVWLTPAPRRVLCRPFGPQLVTQASGLGAGPGKRASCCHGLQGAGIRGRKNPGSHSPELEHQRTASVLTEALTWPRARRYVGEEYIYKRSCRLTVGQLRKQ